MPYAREWTVDEVLKHREILEVIAMEYLGQYTGDFTFLIEMRNLDQKLNVGQLRGVINCIARSTKADMLNDITAVMTRAKAITIQRDRKFQHSMRVIAVRATFHMPFVVSTHHSAKNVHQLDPTRSRMLWHPNQNAFHPVIWAECTSLSSSPGKTKMIDAQEAAIRLATGKWFACPSCEKFKRLR
jgi:hypothetical protein